MYEPFYGLRGKPFSILPDPDMIYWGRMHSMAFTMLDFGVMNNAGFTVITGEIGSGKTTLVRHLLNDQLADSHGLAMSQVAASRSAPALARPQRPQAAFSCRLHPVANRAHAHAKRSSRFDSRHAAAHRLHHHLPQVRLRRLVQFSGISFRLHPRITHKALFGAPVSKWPELEWGYVLRSTSVPADEKKNPRTGRKSLLQW